MGAGAQPAPRESAVQETLGFEEVWKTLALPPRASTLALGETLTPERLRETPLAAPSAPPAEALRSLGPARHRDTLASMLADPGPVLQKLPSLELALEGDARGESASDYETLGLLGEGGMGRVWLALQRSMQRDLAVKTLKSDVVHEAALRSLLCEGLLTGQLEHPNIVPVHQLGRDQRGLPALVMKRIVGVSWAELLKHPEHPTLARFGRGHEDPLDAHVELLLRVCDAVHYAHRHHVVHRDLKPENVMVGDFGEVYLVDWGIATMCVEGAQPERGALVGTPVYMAPEMVAGEAPDARTDVFLLGAVLHEVLTGKPRHGGTTLYEVLASAFAPEPVRYGTEVPEELGALANRATSPRREDRPQSAEEFRAALLDWRRHRGSLELAREARARLAELEAPGAEKDAVRFARVSSECRFGFLQALREWDGNASARADLDRCLRCMLRFSLANEDLANARGLLAELQGDTAAERAELEALTARVREREHLAQRAQAHDREMDLGVSAGQRRKLLFGMAGLIALAGLVIIGTHREREILQVNPRIMLFGTAVPALALALVVLRKREVYLANEANRKLIAAVATCFFALILNRVHGNLAGMNAPTILSGDLLVLSVTGLMAAVLFQRVFLALSLFAFAGSVLSALEPALSGPAFVLGLVPSFLLVAVRLDGAPAPAKR